MEEVINNMMLQPEISKDSNEHKQIQNLFNTPSFPKLYKGMVRKIFEIGGRLKLDSLTLHIAVKLLLNVLVINPKVEDKELIVLTLLLISSKFNQTEET